MKATGHIRFSTAGLRFAAAAGCLVFALTAFPLRGFAQCEQPPAAQTEANTVASNETNDITGTLIPDVEKAWSTDVLQLSTTLGSENKTSYAGILARMNKFWTDWFTAWQNMAAQLNASTDDETRQLSSFKDASNALAASRDEGEQRVKAQKLYQPTGQACLFDSTNKDLPNSQQVTNALEDAYEWDFVQLGNNEKVYTGANPNIPASNGNGTYSPQDSTAQYGPAEEQSRRWYNYANIFCDYRAENGNAGCASHLPGTYPLKVGYTPTLTDNTKPPYAVLNPLSPTLNDPHLLAYSNMDVEPTLLLFSQYTVDMYNITELTAIDQMMFNITGYRIPMPMLTTAMSALPGMEETLKRRRYIAQMSTVNALLYSLIADRAPGPGVGCATATCAGGGSPPSANAQAIYALRTKEYGATPNAATDTAIQTAASCAWWNVACWISKGWSIFWNGSVNTQFANSQAQTPPQ